MFNSLLFRPKSNEVILRIFYQSMSLEKSMADVTNELNASSSSPIFCSLWEVIRFHPNQLQKNILLMQPCYGCWFLETYWFFLILQTDSATAGCHFIWNFLRETVIYKKSPARDTIVFTIAPTHFILYCPSCFKYESWIQNQT